MTQPRVTVIVPVRNERQSIVRALDSIRAQSEERLQILVVDGDSDDGTKELVAELASTDDRIELLHNPQHTVPFALNIALARAEAPWLVRVDAHATIPPGYVARAVELLETGAWGGVGGVKRAVGITRSGQAIAAAMSSRFGVGGSIYHYGTASREVEHIPFGAYPADAARQIGGWGEEFTVNQDFEFDHRLRNAGHRILFDPTLVIDWECRQTLGSLFQQYRRYGRGKVKVALRHPTSVKPRHLVPPAFVACVVVAAGAAPVSRWGRRLAGAVLAPYAVVMAVASQQSGRGLFDPWARATVPSAFLSMHLGWGMGFWEGLYRELRGRS